MKFAPALILLLASTAGAQPPTSYYGYLPVILEPLPWTSYSSYYDEMTYAGKRQAEATADRVSCMTAIAEATAARSKVSDELPDVSIDEINSKMMEAMKLLNAGDDYRDNGDIWYADAQACAEKSWWATAEASFVTAAGRYEDASLRYGLAEDAANEALMGCYVILMTIGMP